MSSPTQPLAVRKADPLSPRLVLCNQNGVPLSLSHPGCMPYFYWLTRLLLKLVSNCLPRVPQPLGRPHVRPKFQSTSGPLEEGKEKIKSVSSNSYSCCLHPGRPSVSAQGPPPCSAAWSSLQAADCITCWTHLLYFSSLRDGCPALPAFQCLKTIVSYTLPVLIGL